MVAGRTSEPRTVTVTRTGTSVALTAAPAGTFTSEDIGRTVTGTGIPAGATIASIGSDTLALMSAAATSTGTGAVTLGLADTANGYRGWSPETTTEAGSYTVTANNAGTVPPDRITTNNSPRPAQRGRG